MNHLAVMSDFTEICFILNDMLLSSEIHFLTNHIHNYLYKTICLLFIQQLNVLTRYARCCFFVSVLHIIPTLDWIQFSGQQHFQHI